LPAVRPGQPPLGAPAEAAVRQRPRGDPRAPDARAGGRLPAGRGPAAPRPGEHPPQPHAARLGGEPLGSPAPRRRAQLHGRRHARRRCVGAVAARRPAPPRGRARRRRALPDRARRGVAGVTGTVVAPPVAEPAAGSVKAAPRLLALDVFRGGTVAAMILVNNPGTWGAIYPPLRHAAWHGLTPTDLVFPFFLFVVGVAIAFAILRRRESGAPRAALARKIGRRAVVLAGIGILLSGFPS